MKNCLIVAVLFIVYLPSNGQSKKLSFNDSIIKRSLQRFIYTPDSVANVQSTGICILEVYKPADSIELKSLFSSGNEYNLENLGSLVRGLNNRCNKYIPPGYKLIIPIYFYYNDGTVHPPSKKSLSTAGKIIKKLQRNERVIEPVIETSYPPVR